MRSQQKWLSEGLNSYHSIYSDDAQLPLQVEDPYASGELVLTPHSTTRHLLHLLPESQEGLAAQFIVPEGLQPMIFHHLPQLPMASNIEEASFPQLIPQQESEEGFHCQRTAMVASCPNMSNYLVPYSIFRQQDRPFPHPVIPQRGSRSDNESDPPPPPPTIIQHFQCQRHQLLSLSHFLERMVDKVSRQVTQVMQQLRELEHHIRILKASHGECVWRIRDVVQQRRDAILERSTSLCSSPFYIRGYKMCVRAYLNGDGSGRGTHLSVFLVMMKGEFDDLLQWPFRDSVTITLLDQSGQNKHISHSFRPNPDSSSFQRPQTNTTPNSGLPQFAPLSVLLPEGHYVINNVLYIKVKITFD